MRIAPDTPEIQYCQWIISFFEQMIIIFEKAQICTKISYLKIRSGFDIEAARDINVSAFNIAGKQVLVQMVQRFQREILHSVRKIMD